MLTLIHFDSIHKDQQQNNKNISAPKTEDNYPDHYRPVVMVHTIDRT